MVLRYVFNFMALQYAHMEKKVVTIVLMVCVNDFVTYHGDLSCMFSTDAQRQCQNFSFAGL